jgi:hypothetical protein
MTLLELLVQELPKQGGWPQDMLSVVQSKVDGELNFYEVEWQPGETPNIMHHFGLYLDNPVQIQPRFGVYIVITKAQYEAALNG